MNKGPSEYSLKQRTFNNEDLFLLLPLLSSALAVGGDSKVSPGTKASLKHLSPGPAQHRRATVEAAGRRLCFQLRALWYLTTYSRKLVLRRKTVVDFFFLRKGGGFRKR